ncbi:MAG: ATP-binding protein, partial [Gallionella sp.]|nr:ATP-binding protein [Gallionella sp.]
LMSRPKINNGTRQNQARQQQMMPGDDVEMLLLPVFLEEADELRPTISDSLRALRAEPKDESQRQLINRLLHTFKGSARMTGAMRIGDIIHTMEDRLLVPEPSSGIWGALENDIEQIDALLEELRKTQLAAETDPVEDSSQPEKNAAAERSPFVRMSERLYRTLRQTAKELNKRVNLELVVNDVELEGYVLEKMAAPLEHLLRNAIAHGVEKEQQRIDSDKELIGEVQLHLRQKNNEVIIEFSDDGGGLDLAALRAQAIRKGLLDEADISDDQLKQLIFIPGISTATEVTGVSGRGIGMDVVRNEITALGGRIEVNSKPGQGTQFTIHLPAHTLVSHETRDPVNLSSVEL